MLLQLIEILRMKSVPHCTEAIRVMLRDRPPYFAHTWRYHDELVDAIEAGDPKRARRVKQTDLKELRDLVNAIRGEG
jgi:DNA-binding GntR family transcriptional regulator